MCMGEFPLGDRGGVSEWCEGPDSSVCYNNSTQLLHDKEWLFLQNISTSDHGETTWSLCRLNTGKLPCYNRGRPKSEKDCARYCGNDDCHGRGRLARTGNVSTHGAAGICKKLDTV